MISAQETNKNTFSFFFLIQKTQCTHFMSQCASGRDKQDIRELHSVAKWCGAVPSSLEYDL